MKEKTVALVAIIVLGVLETIALLTHTDGQILTFVVTLIAGLGGFYLGQNKQGAKGD